MFVKVLTVEPGEYHFKYVINGHSEGWKAVDSLDLPQDKDGNSVFTLTQAGTIKELAGKPDPLIETGVMALMGADAEDMADLILGAPEPAEGGLLFRVAARRSAKVYVAGDFNNWANNDGGYVTDASALLRWDEDKQVFQRVLPLTAGTYRFKYVYDGAWMAVDPAVLPRDAEGNSVFTMTENGTIEELNRGRRPSEIESHVAAAKENPPAPAAKPEPAPAESARETARAASLQEAEDFSRDLERVIDAGSKPRILYFYHPELASCTEANAWLDSLTGQRFLERVVLLRTDVSKHPATVRRYGVYRIPAAVLLDDSGAVKEKIQFNDDDTRFTFELKAMANTH